MTPPLTDEQLDNMIEKYTESAWMLGADFSLSILKEIKASRVKIKANEDTPALLAEVERLREKMEYLAEVCAQTATIARRALEGKS